MTISSLKPQSKSHSWYRLDAFGRAHRPFAGRTGWIERQNFADACASLWIDGELVHLEDLVLHDAPRDIRTPTHELTIARDVLRTTPAYCAAQLPAWAISADGVRTLRKTAEITSVETDEPQAAGATWRLVSTDPEGQVEGDDDIGNFPGID